MLQSIQICLLLDKLEQFWWSDQWTLRYTHIFLYSSRTGSSLHKPVRGVSYMLLSSWVHMFCVLWFFVLYNHIILSHNPVGPIKSFLGEMKDPLHAHIIHDVMQGFSALHSNLALGTNYFITVVHRHSLPSSKYYWRWRRFLVLPLNTCRSYQIDYYCTSLALWLISPMAGS